MPKKLTKTGNSFAVVLDRPLLESTGIDETTELEIATNGDVIVITPVRRPKRSRKLAKSIGRVNERYSGVFKKLAE